MPRICGFTEAKDPGKVQSLQTAILLFVECSQALCFSYWCGPTKCLNQSTQQTRVKNKLAQLHHQRFGPITVNSSIFCEHVLCTFLGWVKDGRAAVLLEYMRLHFVNS